MSTLLHPVVGRALGGAHLIPIDFAAASLGRPCWGPAALLADLEMRAALVSPPDEPLARLDAARTAISRAPGVFAQTLEVDPWGTARWITAMRDELVAAGWNRLPLEGPPRIASLTRVADLPPGEPDRLRTLADALQSPPYARLTLAESPARWPFVWRRLFARIAALGTVIDVLPRPSAEAPAETDLGAVQRRLGGSRAPFVPRRDGSLLLVEDDTVEPLAETVAALLAGRDDTRAILCGIEHAALDAALGARGLPRLGGVRARKAPTASAWLPLILRLATAPFDPEAAIDLLLLPDHGLSRHHTDRLARAFAEAPGLVSGALARVRPDAEAAYPDAMRRLFAWLTPAAIVDAAELGRRLTPLASLLHRHGIDRDRDLVAEATALANATLAGLVRALPRSGPIEAATLDALLALLSERAALAATRREAGELARADAPEALLAPADTIVWWGFTDEPRPRRLFRPAEARFLRAQGIDIVDPVSELAARSEAARDVVLRARRALVLAVPLRVAGELQLAHPLWSEVLGELALTSEAGRALFRASEPPTAVAITPRLLPPASASWHVATGVALPPQLSVSNLERLLTCPLKLVLDVHGKLRRRAHGAIEGGALLLGRLGHLLVERLHRGGVLRERDAVRPVLAALLADEAAHLSRAGRAAERRHLERVYLAAVKRLVALLDDRGLVVTSVEEGATVRVGDLVVTVRTDLRARDADGRVTIIDLKWSTGSHRRALAAGRAVQLAAYRSASGGAARGVYFGLMRGDAVEADERALDETWRRVAMTLDPLRRRLADGVVPVSGLTSAPLLGEHLGIADGDALSGDPGGTCRYCEYGVLCGHAFHGGGS